MNKQILTLNVGSSSIKYRMFEIATTKITAEGLCERIMVDGHFDIKYQDHKFSLDVPFPTHKDALEYLFTFLIEKKIISNKNDILGVGHRIVQGGENATESMIITDQVLEIIKENIPLAPLHNAPEALIVSEIKNLLPNARNVAVFDTSFHHTIPAVNSVYPIDLKLIEELKIKRYGYHGTSYKYVTEKMTKILNKKEVNLVVLHLGNGASMTAIEKNKSLNTTMGLTPLEGLMMGTRSGNVDPGLIPYLMHMKKWTIADVDNLLNKKSGLLGMTGSSDMRDVANKFLNNDPKAKLALDIFTKRCADYLVKYVNDLKNQIDAVVFTAGIGENAALVRQLIIEKTYLLNLALDNKANEVKIGDYALISSNQSKTPIYVVRTNEELMIFEDTKKLLDI